MRMTHRVIWTLEWIELLQRLFYHMCMCVPVLHSPSAKIEIRKQIAYGYESSQLGYRMANSGLTEATQRHTINYLIDKYNN
jgi:hypothetical protein